MKLRRIGILFFAFILLFSSCKSDKGTTEIGYDIPGSIGTLDPQHTKSTAEKIVLINILEGLVIKIPDGEILPGVAKSWDISEDGKTYTFTLREGLFWEKTKEFEKLPVTGDDFVFAFQRLFSRKNSTDIGSELASPFFSIEDAYEFHTDIKEVEELSVTSPSKNTVVFTLNEPDKDFLEKLTLPQALPCNEEFFKSTKGRYGMGGEFILGNGPFIITGWTAGDRVTLGRNPAYYNSKQVKLETVYLFLHREDSLKRFEDGITHIIKVDTQTGEKMKKDNIQLLPFSDKIWSIGFQGKSEIWGIPYFRQALSYTVNREDLKERFPAGYEVADSFLPSDGEVMSYYNPAKGKEMYTKGLEQLEIDRVPTATIYTPNDLNYEEILFSIQESWKEELNLYISFSQVERETYDSLRRGTNFDIILFPTKIKNKPEHMLSTFITDNSENVFSYNNEIYNRIVGDIPREKTQEEQWNKGRQAENLLLSDVVIIPLYIEESYYAVKGFSGEIDIYLSEDVIRFHPVSQPQP